MMSMNRTRGSPRFTLQKESSLVASIMSRAWVGRALLRRMAPEHKFATAARLCSEVLSGFAEGTLPLDTASEVLHDALSILASKDIKARPASHQSHTSVICMVAPPAPCRWQLHLCASQSSGKLQGSRPAAKHFFHLTKPGVGHPLVILALRV